MPITINGDGTITGLAEGGLEDAKIIEADLKDDAVSLAKMKAETQGGVIYYGASGAPTQLAAGTSGQFLKTQGSGANPVWATVSTDPTTTSGTNNFTVADGNLVIGTAGHGIDFSATADGSGTDSSSLFDDYEEGTWTPIYNSSNDDGGHTMATQTGHYRKVGSVVHFSCITTWSGGSGGSGYCFVEGLPYDPGGSTFWMGHISVDGYTCTSNRYLSEVTIHNNQDLLIIKEMNNSAGGSNYNAPYDGSVSGSLSICGTYTTS